MNKRKLVSVIIISSLFLTLVFAGTYVGVSKYIHNKYKVEQEQVKEEQLLNEKDKSLKDSITLIFKNNDKVEKSMKLKDYKNENSITGDINREELLNKLENKNYSLEKEGEEQMVFSRSTIKKLTPNSYYLGEKDGYFAIYKADSSGKPTIEDESKDVFKNYKMVKELSDLDQEKIVNFEFSFTTKEDAEEKLSEFLS
ncbi:hypothetical protein [Clostridium intestinale]|uniref:Bypass of forespore C C-terminal domain-containing protein n=1 Tax=Clostridium intestinale URNW TaxID=1294142 RepID=U2NM13_9CLOT|nr:hypothetical protein [Clostridium intestinale]ERK30188.1 hypothetical protein CINTURNW_1294 [Clostridium intestinale URNW]